jgi:hypothetical protein
MIKAKNETYEKLERVAEALFTKWGLEVIAFDNFKMICEKTGAKLNIKLSEKTYRNHQDKIVDMIKNLQFRKSLEGLESAFNDTIFDEATSQPQATNVEMTLPKFNNDGDEILAIKLMFASGKTQIYQLIDEPQKQMPQAQTPKEKEYTGLFNYRSNGDVIIRVGTYTGVSVKSKSSIIKTFKTMSWFYKWCLRKIQEAQTGKIKIMPDTPRDVETLKKIVKKIETSMDF